MSHPIAGASLAHEAASVPTWHRLGADEAVKFLGVNSHAGLALQEARTRARLLAMMEKRMDMMQMMMEQMMQQHDQMMQQMPAK